MQHLPTFLRIWLKTAPKYLQIMVLHKKAGSLFIMGQKGVVKKGDFTGAVEMEGSHGVASLGDLDRPK